MSDNWVVQNLQNALDTWNKYLSEIWQLITQSPEQFKGGSIWGVIVNIHDAVRAIGLALLVLFFVVGVMRTCGSFAEVKKPEHALKLFIRFAIAKGVVTYGLELMMALFNIVQGLVSTIMNAAGFGSAQQTVLPQEIIDAVESCGFFESIPLWAVTLIGGLFITVLSFIMIMTVYGRFFKLYLYTAIAPVPLSTFAGEPTQSPEQFKGGSIWGVIVNIHDAVRAIGLALLVLFFVVGVMRTCGSFAEVKKPEHALKLFIRFAIAKGVVTYGLELMMALFNIVQGLVSTIMNAAGFGSAQQTVLPQEIIDAVESCGFFESIPLWAVTLIGGLFITVLSFIMIMTVYGRFFKLYLYTAIAPVPLSTFAGEPTQNVGKSFIKSYAAVCLEGAIIVLACIIFSLFAASPPAIDPNAAAVTQVWSYIGELVFNMLVLVGAVKMADRVVREMMGL